MNRLNQKRERGYEVSKKGRIRYIFTSSNTSQGFYTFIPQLLEGLKKVYILKGAAGSGKSTFIRLLGEAVSEQGYEIEYWISAMEPVNPDGLYIPQLEAAVVNGSLPQAIDPKYPGGVSIIINLGDYWDEKAVYAQSTKIMELVERIHSQNNKAYDLLRNAGRVKDEMNKIGLKHLNIEKLQQLVEKLASEIMEEAAVERHYFASALTADGMVNYVDEISAECKKRFVFKGPPGSGKSTVINEIARKAKKKGLSLEYYHCGLKQEDLSMLIIRNLEIALIDAGNSEMTIKPWDIIIDMRDFLDNYDSDLLEIANSEIYRKFEAFLMEAQIEMEGAQRSLKELKKIYAMFMDFESLEKKRREVGEKLLSATDD